MTMLAPVFITRSVQVEATKGSKELVSTTFIARFQDGGEKMLNKKTWQPVGLLRQNDIGEIGMAQNECPLYYRDWSKNPIFGKWDKHYPTTKKVMNKNLFNPTK